MGVEGEEGVSALARSIGGRWPQGKLGGVLGEGHLWGGT